MVAVSGHADGQVYELARGRFAPRLRVEDRLWQTTSVVEGRPTGEQFVACIVREMRIRFYQPKTVKHYRNALRGLLRWFGRPPHQLTREDVREYLLYLVDAGAGPSWVGINLSAIRTAFDKMCLRQVTLGLVTPRSPKRLPVVLSTREVRRLLEAAPSLRDKLLLGLMYATGMRVSEVTRLRYRDLDFDRGLVNVWQGKGRRDRQVVLSNTLRPLLAQLAQQFHGDDYVFPADRNGRHLSPRTVQRAMQRALRIAGIQKRATPHTLRHSFATHSFENGCDIRHIQKLLGHAKLETTTIYVKVARPGHDQHVPSPLDVASGKDGDRSQPSLARPTRASVGRMQLHFRPQARRKAETRTSCVTIAIANDPRPVYLTGIVAREARPGWITLGIPPLERWEESLRWLTPEQRERIAGAEFFDLLSREITHRFMQLEFG